MAAATDELRDEASGTTAAIADDEAAAAAAAAAGANPGLLGLPVFIAGAIPLGLYLIGYKEFATGGLLANTAIVAGLGLAVATFWAIKVGAGAVAAIFGIFSGFWLSFSFFVFGATHGWFVPAGTEPEAALAAAGGGQNVYLLSWTIAVVILTLATLRLPLAFTALFALVAVTFFFVLLFNITGDTLWATIAGIVVFAFTAIGVYLFVDAMGQATGGKAMPLGNPILK